MATHRHASSGEKWECLMNACLGRGQTTDVLLSDFSSQTVNNCSCNLLVQDFSHFGVCGFSVPERENTCIR